MSGRHDIVSGVYEQFIYQINQNSLENRWEHGIFFGISIVPFIINFEIKIFKKNILKKVISRRTRLAKLE